MLDLNSIKDIKINVISDFVFWIFLIIIGFIGHLITKLLISKFRKVKIKRIDVRNVPKRVDGLELPIFQNQGELKNYIENELVIENSKENLLIDNLVVDNISVNSYLYEDIMIQNGFDSFSQDIVFVIFNNGNKNSSLRNYQVKGHYLNNENGKDKIIFKSELKADNLSGGEIKKIFSRKLTDHSIVKFFSNNVPDNKQSIKIELINNLNQEIESEIEYHIFHQRNVLLEIWVEEGSLIEL